MKKSYREEELERAKLTYALLAEAFKQKCSNGEITADNVGIYSEILENAKNSINYQKSCVEKEKAAQAQREDKQNA